MIRLRPIPGLTIATLLGLCLLIGLGVWQLQRLTWKTALIAAADARAHAAPVPLASLIGRPPSDVEYAHASAAGRFLPGEAYLFTELEGGRIGYEIIVPFRLESGRALLVDRGFVAAAGKRPAPFGAPPAGEVVITGLVRASQAPGLFTPKPDVAKRTWYGRDGAGLAEALGVRLDLPLMLAEDAGRSGVTPEGGVTRLHFRNEHLQYALTWFALGLALVGVYFAYHRSKGRLTF
jgi:surfeit locus 1 family protein